MASRALIIAIEEYPNASGLAGTLDGTIDAALSFRTWLQEKWQADGITNGQIILCSEPVQPGGDGASRKDILKALDRLKTDGRDATEELFVYFSGHGFSFSDRPGSRADIVVSSDFETLRLSGETCLSLDKIIAWLRGHLGPGHHYFFIDACRNPLNSNQVVPSGSLLPWDLQPTEEATTYLIQSTADGDVAAVGGPFPGGLIDGLKGTGRAKVWDPSRFDAMLVHYGSLLEYLKNTVSGQTISHTISGVDRETDAVFSIISPVPDCTLKVEIKGGASGDVGRAAIRRFRSQEESRAISGNVLELALQPDHYTIAVDIDGSRVEPRDPVLVDVFDDVTVTFSKPGPPGPPPAGVDFPLTEVAAEGMAGAHQPPSAFGDRAAAADASFPAGDARPRRRSGRRSGRPQTMRRVRKKATVEFRLPPMLKVEIHNLDSGQTATPNPGRQTLEPGRYDLKAFDERDGSVVADRALILKPGYNPVVDLMDWRGSLPHRSIAGRLPDWDGAPDFSESMSGPMIDTDLDLWLAVIGAGRITGSSGRYSKLSTLPLYDFGTETPFASPLYVLAGFENAAVDFRAAVSTGATVNWNATEQPGDMTGLRHVCLHPSAGACLVSIAVDDSRPYTVASFAMENHATLVTVSREDAGSWSVFQYILPLEHLEHHLLPQDQAMTGSRNHLRDVRYLTQSGRAFEARRQLSDEAADISRQNELETGTWHDAVGTARTAYALIRRGADFHNLAQQMTLYYPDLPDCAALERLAGDVTAPWKGTPLFLDGLRAFPDHADHLPLSAGLLDFSSPWTAWFGAVS